MICPNCKTENAPDAVFCENCGTKLAPSEQPSFAIPTSPEAPAPAAEPAVKTRWPIALPILMGAAFLIEVYFFFDFLKAINEVGLHSFSAVFALCANLATVALLALAAVFFIMPTRQKPFLSAIPRIALIALTLSSIVIAAAGSYLNSNAVPMKGIGMVAAVIYIIDAAARPRGKALAIIHAVLAGCLCMGNLVNLKTSSVSFGFVIDLVQVILMNAAWAIALFTMGRKKKKA